MSKVCVATTYKNNYNLFNAFFNFYNDIWKVEKFILFCGISPCGNTEEEIIKIMENKTEKFKNKIQIADSNKYVYNVRLLQNSKISLFLYDTQDVYKQNIDGTYGTGKIFDGIIRPFLFKLSNYLNNIFNYCEYYLSVDQDDFLYIPPLNFNNILKNSKDYIWFKTLEYIPNEKFNPEEIMNFSEVGYYFEILSKNNNTIPNKIKSFNKHGWSGKYHNPYDFYQRKINISKRNTFFETLNGAARCGHWERKIDITNNLNEHNIAFCFGCLDLQYLLNNRNFFKTKLNSPDAKEVNILDKTDDFYKYYHRLDLIKYKTNILCKFFKNDLQFLHIPKNAGTSIEEYGRIIKKLWGKYNPNLKSSTELGINRQHLPQTLPNSDLFCIIRNPFDRIKSQFLHEIYFNKNFKNLDINKYIQEKIKLLNENVYFYKKNETDVGLKGGPHHYDNHFLPQINYSQLCKHILLLDNLEIEFIKLLEKYNLDFYPKKFIKYNSNEKVIKGEISKVKLNLNLNYESKNWINNYYSKDIELYHSLVKKRMNKNIFIYWKQKVSNSPELVKKCIQSWYKNNNYVIHILDDNNIHKYIDYKSLIKNFEIKKISIQHESDIIRICLLEKYGGIWCDATTFCIEKLDTWINKYCKNGFFAFEKPNIHDPKRLLSNWFIYGKKNSKIIKEWKNSLINYWNTYNEPNDLFPMHYLFTDLYNNNSKIKKEWDEVIKISANGPHFLNINGLANEIKPAVKSHIDNKKSFIYKLTYKQDLTHKHQNCIIDYLFNKYQ